MDVCIYHPQGVVESKNWAKTFGGESGSGSRTGVVAGAVGWQTLRHEGHGEPVGNHALRSGSGTCRATASLCAGLRIAAARAGYKR